MALAAAGDMGAKMELSIATSEMMPAGIPKYRDMIYPPPMQLLISEHGRPHMMKVIVLLLGDLNEAFNVVRPMSDSQMIDIAAMMLDECGDFRLEDYIMLLTMVKRGDLVKVMDRIDMGVIGAAMNEYYLRRRDEGLRAQEEEYAAYEQSLKGIARPPETEQEQLLSAQFGKLAGEMKAWEKEDEEKERQRDERRRKEVQAYASKYNLDWDEILKQFGKQK